VTDTNDENNTWGAQGQRLYQRCNSGHIAATWRVTAALQALPVDARSAEPGTVTDQRRKTFNVRSEMITRCKLNIQKYRETIAALEERAGN